MSNKLKNKQMPVSCRMFLRYLKEANLFKEFCQEAEMRLIKDNNLNAYSRERPVKYHTFTEKWLWYVSNGGLNSSLSKCPISNIIDIAMIWSETRRGHTYWSKVNSAWKNLFYRYHSERALNYSLKRKHATDYYMADDANVFVKMLTDFLRQKARNAASSHPRNAALDF